MVVKIQPPSSKVEATILYNERKADGPKGIRHEDSLIAREEDGHIVTTVNVPEGSTLEDEFQRLKEKNARKSRGRNLEKAAFHMSVNPGPKDNPLSEAAMVQLIGEMMDELGYGECPYRVYKHTDIDREHYHVVSTRIGQDGKKVNDSFENRRINKIAEKLAQKYGYTVGIDDELSNEEEMSPSEAEDIVTPIQPDSVQPSVEEIETEPTPKKKFVPPFDRDSSIPVSEQIKNIHEEAMTWSFSTPEQYCAIMRWRFNVEAMELNDGMRYLGIDRSGNECSVPVTEEELEIKASQDIISKCTTAEPRKLKAQRKRIETYAQSAMKDCPTMKEYRKRLNSKGIYLIVSFTEDGQPFGITWLDRATKCAFKGSETSYTLEWLKNAAQENNWEIKQTHKFDKTTSVKHGRKDRYSIGKEIGKQIERKKAEAQMKKMTRDQDERAEGNAIDKSVLNDDPNNIKI